MQVPYVSSFVDHTPFPQKGSLLANAKHKMVTDLAFTATSLSLVTNKTSVDVGTTQHDSQHPGCCGGDTDTSQPSNTAVAPVL